MAKVVKNRSACHKPVARDKAHSANESNDPNDPALKTTCLLPVLIIVLFSFSVYFTALFGDFVYDDMDQILKNPWIKDIRNIPTIFFNSTWSFNPEISTSNYYRPLMHVLYMFNDYLFGLKSWGFHLINILFHCGVSVLVFLVIWSFLTENRASVPLVYLSPPFIAAMLFAAHPIHAEAVTWIAGLPDVAFTFFYLLSFYLYIRSKGGVSRDYLFSVVCFTLAAFFKEPALTLPIILLAYDYVFGELRTRPIYHAKRYIPYAIIGAVYLVLRMRALGGFAPQRRYEMLSSYQYVINVFPLFIHYLEKLLLPLNLNAFYVFHPIASLLELKGILSFIGTIVFLVFLYLALKKSRVVFLGLLFVTVPLLPVLYIPALGENTFTERYLYLPSVGYVLVLAVLFSWAMEKVPRAGRSITIITIVSIAIVALYTAGTIDRNTVWKDNFNLWSDTVKKSPESADAHNNLGNVSTSKGQLDRAIAEFQMALRLKPDFTEAHDNLGNAYKSKGQLDKAIAEYQTAIRLEPDDADAHNNLGAAYISTSQLDMAIGEYQMALRLKPDFIEAHNNLGNAYKSKNQLDKAIAEYQIALHLEPDDADVHKNLGVAYVSIGQLDKAIAEYQIALHLKPGDADVHNNLGTAYAYKSQLDKAIAEYQMALRLKPDFAMAHKNLGAAYAADGQLDKAIAEYQMALRLKPDYALAHYNLAVVYLKKGDVNMARREIELTLNIKPDLYEARQLLNSITSK
jgi:tetratricopeptide (TPR) repeat protein